MTDQTPRKPPPGYKVRERPAEMAGTYFAGVAEIRFRDSRLGAIEQCWDHYNSHPGYLQACAEVEKLQEATETLRITLERAEEFVSLCSATATKHSVRDAAGDCYRSIIQALWGHVSEESGQQATPPAQPSSSTLQPDQAGADTQPGRPDASTRDHSPAKVKP